MVMAIANANYEIMYANFGTNGRVSDGGVIEQTDFYQRLLNSNLNLPERNNHNGLPYVFVSDEALAMRTDLMEHYNIRLTTYF